MLSRLLSIVCVLFSLLSSGCETTGYQGPKLLTWNVTIDSTPPGAELAWRTRKEETQHPLGKAPVTASIPLPVDELGFFDDVFLYATANGKTTFLTTNDILVGGPLSSEGYHRAEKAALLPPRVSVNAYKASQFETRAGLGMLREYEKNPDMWKPYVTSVEGKVLSVQESGQGCIAQLIVENQKNVVIFWPLTRMPNVVEGTYLKVLGTVSGRTSGTNAFGGTVTALTFQGYAYAADWFLTNASTQYVPGRKELFDKWAEGSLFVGDGLVSTQ